MSYVLFVSWPHDGTNDDGKWEFDREELVAFAAHSHILT